MAVYTTVYGVTVAQAAEALGVSRQRVHQLVGDRRIRFRRDGNPLHRRRLLLHQADVQREIHDRDARDVQKARRGR